MGGGGGGDIITKNQITAVATIDKHSHISTSSHVYNNVIPLVGM